MAEGRSTYVRLANLARELGVEYSTLHKWLQRHHPRPPGENHQRWLLSPSQVAAARTAFDSRRLSALLTEREARYERAWEIRENGGTYTLTDLGSTNGTQLNGQTVQSRELQDGDRITIGTTVLEFRRG